MPTVYARNCSVELYDKIRALAEKRHRSFAAEVLTLLDKAVQDEDVVPQTTVAKEVDLGDVKELGETEVAEVREQEEVDRSPVQVDTVALGRLEIGDGEFCLWL